MIRDAELNRLIKYAQGMGISVRFKPYVKRSKDWAQWTIDGTEITVYTTNKTSKIEKILSLIHELGHHKSFVADDRIVDPKVEDALDKDDTKKSARRTLYLDEVKGTKHWHAIYRDTNCQFNLSRLNMQMELDLWSYEVYCETGRFPTLKTTAKKRKQLRDKHRC